MITKELEQIMQIDSTSGKEGELANFIARNYYFPGAILEIQRVGNGTVNLYYKWGKPKIVFCTHLDTVPPFIKPTIEGNKIFGRGACDAKGQIVTFSNLCKKLHSTGESDFGLLLVAGEEVGSKGAKVANTLIKGCEYFIIGEPTENRLIKAGKGIQLYDVKITGESCHSGYPQYGDDAIERFRCFLNDLSKTEFPDDPVLGKTTYNIGMLSSPNPYNIVPELVRFKLYFRTTFTTYNLVERYLKDLSTERIIITKEREDIPLNYLCINEYESDVVAFGCDAPCLKNLGKPLMYGAGSIKVAHTDNEYIDIADIERAIDDLTSIYYKLKRG